MRWGKKGIGPPPPRKPGEFVTHEWIGSPLYRKPKPASNSSIIFLSDSLEIACFTGSEEIQLGSFSLLYFNDDDGKYE